MPNPLSRSVEEYLFSCRARGLNPRTVTQSYGFPLRKVLLPFCAEQGVTEVGDLTRTTLDRLSAQLRQSGGARKGSLSPETIHTYLRAVNHFLVWAESEGEPVKGKCRLPRLPKRDIDILTREEIELMEDGAKTERDKLIIRLLADTGIRVGELVGLTLDDVTERDRKTYIRVTGKGERDRLVPLLPPMRKQFMHYVTRGRTKEIGSDRVFLGLSRRPAGGYEALTVSGVQQMIRNLAQIVGIKKRVHPHLFRHSFATYQINRQMNALHLADILGHSSLTMIIRTYTHLSPSDTFDALLRTMT